PLLSSTLFPYTTLFRSRPVVTWTFAPCKMNMSAVPGHAVIVAVGERETVCGLVWESGSELRDLNLAAPSRTAVRGGAVPHIVLTDRKSTRLNSSHDQIS